MDGSFKINKDGAFKHGLAGCSMIIRDSRVVIVREYDVVSSKHIELTSYVEGLMARSVGIADF